MMEEHAGAKGSGLKVKKLGGKSEGNWIWEQV
jgi:hypothetical protein